MTLSSVLFISRSVIAAADTETVVNQIVAVMAETNARLGVTGAMLFTGTHFAQVIEGQATPIDTVMARIRADPRHDDLVVVHEGVIAERRFADWKMAYFGPSQFVSQHVARLLDDPMQSDRRRAADWLTDLLYEFTSKM